MNTLFKLIIIPAVLFGVIDWAAENPAKVKAFRDKIVKQFDEGTKIAAKELNEAGIHNNSINGTINKLRNRGVIKKARFEKDNGDRITIWRIRPSYAGRYLTVRRYLQRASN